MTRRRTVRTVLIAGAVGLLFAWYISGNSAAQHLQHQQTGHLTTFAELVRSDVTSDQYNAQSQTLITQFCTHTAPKGLAALNVRYRQTVRACHDRQQQLTQNTSISRSFYDTQRYIKSITALKDPLSKLSATDITGNRSVISGLVKGAKVLQPPAALKSDHNDILASLDAMQTLSDRLAQTTSGYDQAKTDQAADAVKQSYAQLHQALTKLQASVAHQEATFDTLVS